MRNKLMILTGIMLLANQAQCSPRISYLRDRLNQAKTVELQAKYKADAETRRYKATRDARKSIERELTDVIKREEREYKQAREAYHAARLDVESMYQDDITAPTGITWR